ncbi:hypothetical protein C8Q76DRAFT_633801, partial [Earliella scabrosa]
MLIFTTLRAPRTEAQIQNALALEVGVEPENPAPNRFFEIADQCLRDTIIREWEETMSTAKLRRVVCAPCARYTVESNVQLVHPNDVDLELLRNDDLPPRARPTSYNFELYKRALLCPAGMTSRTALAPFQVCGVCFKELVVKARMPKLSLANWFYYGHDALPEAVRNALRNSTQFDRLLVARARGSRISYRFTELKAKRRQVDDVEASEDSIAAQRFVKGNVIVMPQNSTHLNNVLPPPPSVIRDTVCAVFVGTQKPTTETIRKLSPVLARKSIVRTIIEFLVADNPHYACDTTFHGLSTENLRLLFDSDTDSQDAGVPCAMTIGFIQDSEAIRGVSSDYTGRNEEVNLPQPGGDILMENVGYTCGDDSPVAYREMKMQAINHCLNGGTFIRSQSGSRFIPDFENPSLLTWMFPHLDPWGIGGFHHPNRQVPITMEEQLKYLLSIHDSPFEKDADFAFVYFNILQKKHVCDSVRFRVKVSQQRAVVRDLLSIDKDLLARLIEIYKVNPAYRAQTVEESNLVALVNRLGTVLHDLPGTTGYKLRMRNEIRALVNHKGTPAFFVTLNPSDIHNPLVRLMAGENICLEDLENGEDLHEWRRKLFVAQHPGACARFFHAMISSFIDIILRYGRSGRGLLG